MPAQMVANRKLNAQQEKFVTGYLSHWNGTKAAIEAGYSEQSAAAQAYSLLNSPKIAKKIDELLLAEQEDSFVSRFRLMLELYRIATVDVVDMYEDWGKPTMRMKEADELTSEQRACIQSVSMRSNQHGTTTTLKMYDKIAASSLLAKILKLVEAPKQGNTINLMQHIEAQRDVRDRRIIEDPSIRRVAKQLAGMLDREPSSHGKPLDEGGVSDPPSPGPAR